MNKVLYLTNIPAPYKVAFFNELAKKIDLTVVFESFTDPDREKTWLKKDNIAFPNFFLSENGITSIHNAFRRVVGELNKGYDIVVISTYSTPLQKKLISFFKRKKIRYAISSDGGYIKNDWLLKRIAKNHYLSGASFYFSPSQVTDDYLRHYGAKTKIYRYPFTSVTACDISSFASFDETQVLSIKKSLGVTEDKVVIGVGSFIYRKGWDLLLDSITDSRIGYYIIGGDVSDEYKAVIREKKLNNVHFLKFMDKDKVFLYYRISDLFCLPTREDIWGLVVNEALANGLPVVTTNMCIAGRELINNENGRLVDVTVHGCPQELDKAIHEILFSDKYAEYSSKAFETAQNYTIEKMAESYANAFLTSK